MILAAGFGTRLGGLSDLRPKPLLPVCDVALLRYALALLRGHGVRDVIVNLHHRGELIEAELGGEVAYSREETILGTGGGIRRASPFFGGETFAVMNGKIVLELDLDAVLAHHRRTGALATLVVREDPDAARWGAIDVGPDGMVRGMLGAGATMFTGVHLIEPRLLELLPAEGESCIVRQAYLPALAQGLPVAAYVARGYFFEHSTPERYLRGNLNLLGGGVTLAHPPGPLRGVDPTAQVEGEVDSDEIRVGPGARVAAGARVGRGVVVGRNAEVAAAADLERVVVWPGARAEGALRDAIVTPAGIFPAA